MFSVDSTSLLQIKEQRAMYYSLYMYWKLEEEKEEKRIARTKEREVPKDNSLSKAFASTGDCLQIARKAWDTELRKWRARKRYDQKTAKHAAENLKKVLKMTIINLKKVDIDLDKDFKADFPDCLLECPEVPENGGELPFSQPMEVDDEDEVVINGNSEQPMDSVSDEDTSANEPVRTSSTRKQSSKERGDRFDTSLSPIDEVEDNEVVMNGEAKEDESAKVKKEVILEDGDSDLPEEERENKIAVLMSSSSNEDEKEVVQVGLILITGVFGLSVFFSFSSQVRRLKRKVRERNFVPRKSWTNFVITAAILQRRPIVKMKPHWQARRRNRLQNLRKSHRLQTMMKLKRMRP